MGNFIEIHMAVRVVEISLSLLMRKKRNLYVLLI